MKKLTYTAMAAVLICVCSWISIPLVVPFTMQTFAVFFVLLFLGGKNGTAAVGLYLLLGAIGLPVFSGFQGGVGHLLGPTGGYILGFLFTGISYMLFEPAFSKQPGVRWIALSVGLALCYLTGTVWFVVVFGTKGTQYTFLSALSLCVFPYIIPDFIKMFLAFRLCEHLKKHITAG